MDSDECGCKIKVEPSEIVLYECQFCKHLEFEDYEALESHLEVHTEEERSLCIKQESDSDEVESSHSLISDDEYLEEDYLAIVREDYNESEERLAAGPWHNSIECQNADYRMLPREGAEIDRVDPEETNTKFTSNRKQMRLLRDTRDDEDEIVESNKMAVFSEEKEFPCDVCSKSFARKQSLVIHLRVHTGERPYTCKECGAGFKQNGDLTMHVRTHLGMKPYSCETCNATFLRLGDRNRHMITHNEVKPFQCDACGKKFTRSYQLKLHWQNKHSEGVTWRGKDVRTGEKVEGKAEYKKNRFNCNSCSKTFKDRRNLKVHNLLHTGYKPLKCEVCNKSFSHSGSFNIHKRIHTGEKPYPCGLCSKKFNCSSAVGKHYRRAHTKQTLEV